MTHEAQLILHVGAHRTGSTSLQWRLDALSDTLRQKGTIALTPPREGKRGSPTLRDALKARPPMSGRWPALRQRLALRAARRLLADRISTASAGTCARRVILSDELMLGSPFGPEGESMYPNADRALAALAHILPQKPAEVHLVLRSYDSFLRSVYAMSAVYVDGVAPLEKIRSRLTAVDHGWPDLVEVLRRKFPSARLILSTLEGTDADVILKHLLDFPADLPEDFCPPPCHLNRAPTVAAIEMALGLPRSDYDPDKLISSHANSDFFDPLSSNEKVSLFKRYVRDCAQIAERCDVEWIASDAGFLASHTNGFPH